MALYQGNAANSYEKMFFFLEQIWLLPAQLLRSKGIITTEFGWNCYALLEDEPSKLYTSRVVFPNVFVVTMMA